MVEYAEAESGRPECAGPLRGARRSGVGRTADRATGRKRPTGVRSTLDAVRALVLYGGVFGNTPSICGTSPKQRQASQAMRLEKGLPTAPGEDAHREQHDTWDMPPAMGVHPGVPCRRGRASTRGRAGRGMPRIEGRRPSGAGPTENSTHREAGQRAEPSQRRPSHSAFSLRKGRAPIKELGDFAGPPGPAARTSVEKRATSSWDASHSDLQGTDHAFELVSAAVSEWSRSWSQKLEVAGSSPTPVTFCADGRDFAL